MIKENVIQKLKILAESAKYDVSCSSSGTVRRGRKGELGNTVGGWGICHSFAEDGRCISLLKVMLTNRCIYDCAYCINRRTNDIPRATFSVTELVELTMEFYRRNYIEGLFLSSGVVGNPDYTMERLVRVAKDLRTVHHFNGYIHLKSIPGSSRELVREAGLYADRLSVNFRYICKVIDTPRSIETNFADPDVLAFSQMWKRVDWERIRLTQFVRFQKAKDGTFFAAVEPEKNALPLVVSHFRDRFNDQCWIIYDIRRAYGFYYDKVEVRRVTFEEDERTGHLITGLLDETLMAADELLFQSLWKTYFKAICIKERLNPKKHRQDMPVRYWKYLTEKQK